MKEESLFNFSDDYLRKIRKISKRNQQRVVIGYKRNEYGEPIVTTAIPIQVQQDKVGYVKKKSILYDSYFRKNK